MDLQLKGHRAIVTGSSAGIGEAIARRLAAEGAAVIVHGRRAHAVSAVAQAISADGGQAEGLTADLSDPGDGARLISGALAASCPVGRAGSAMTGASVPRLRPPPSGAAAERLPGPDASRTRESTSESSWSVFARG